MDLEEKSREYADKKLQTCLSQIIPENSDNDEEIMFARHVERYDSYDIEQAYEDGYNEALNSQWKDPKVELPEDGEWVIIVAGEYGVQAAVWNEHYQCWDDAEGDDFMYKKDVVTLWMSIPDLPEKGGEK